VLCVANPIEGNSASHVSETDLPASAHVIVINGIDSFPVLYDLRGPCGGTPTPMPTATVTPTVTSTATPTVTRTDANCYAKSYPHTQGSRNSAPAPVAAKEIVISDR